MQQQPQVNFAPPPPPPPGPVYEESIQPQVQGEFSNLPPGQNRGVFHSPPPHGQAVAQAQAPKVGSRLDPIELVNILLRFVAVLMIFIAVVIIGATKYVDVQSEEYYDRRTRSMETRWVYTVYKLSTLSSIKYFLAANSIVLFYSVATLVISVSSMLMKNNQGNGTLRNKLLMLFVAGDLAAVFFLFSAVGSAAASKDTLSYVAELLSNGTVTFCKIVKDEFCDKWIAGIVMSMFGAVAYLLLLLLSVFSLTKMNNK